MVFFPSHRTLTSPRCRYKPCLLSFSDSSFTLYYIRLHLFLSISPLSPICLSGPRGPAFKKLCFFFHACVCACVCSPATKYSNRGQSSFKLTLRSGSEASVLLWALRDDGVLSLGRDEKMSVCAQSGRDVSAVLAVAGSSATKSAAAAKYIKEYISCHGR